MPSLPLELLSSAKPADVPRGSLLIPRGEEPSGVELRVDDQVRLAVPIDRSNRRAFNALNIGSRHEPILAISDWSVRVDPASSCSTGDRSPEPGDLFIMGEDAGLVVRLDHATRYALLDGTLLDREPNWGTAAYIGFTRWAAGVLVDDRFVPLSTMPLGAEGT